MRGLGSKVRLIAFGGIVAALYVALTFASSALHIVSSSSFTQLRLAECLCILPIFTPAAIPGLFVGCILSNILFGGGPIDVIFGSLATLAGAIGTYMLRSHRHLAVFPPIMANTIVMPLVFIAIYEFPQSYFYYAASIFISEFIMIALLGSLLYKGLEKYEGVFKE